MLRDVIGEACQAARMMHRRFGVEHGRDIKLEAWLERMRVKVIEAPLDGAKAQLVRVDNRATIVLPEHVTELGHRRFLMAHELYHLVKEHPSPTPTMMCTPKALRRDDKSEHVYEMGANAFAGELLLPEFLLRKRCEVSPISLEIAWSIARDFDMSILSSAIRLAELSSERCCAVLSHRGAVSWAAPSAPFNVRIPRGTRIDRNSVAWDFFDKGRLDTRAQLVPAYAWLDTSADVDIYEHAVCSHEHGTVLSLLWVPEAVGAQLGMP